MKDLFAEAAELPAEERGAFLDRECADDPKVRAEVDRLLSFGDGEVVLDRIPALPQLLGDLAAPRSLGEGDLLAGRFRIVRLVGSGGMGEVYEARDELLQETLALKTIRPEIVHEPQMRERFRREMLLARQVTHPNVCRVFDYIETDSIAFLTMEFLEGETLSKFLRREKRISLDKARPWIEQMVGALTAAHRAGVVHRDFKGANVFLAKGRNGETRVVVTDFGLARSVHPDAGETRTGMGAGTPAFMAPEQLEGKPVGPAADIYALGLVMYEMATGEPPYAGESPLQVAVKRLKSKPRPPRELSPGIDSKWEQVILRCLEYYPEDRFADASGVARSLASRYSLPWIRLKKSWRLGTVAAVAMLSVALGIGFGRFVWKTGPNEAAENFYQMGLGALTEGTYARAARMLELAQEKDGGYAPISIRLAEAYLRLDQPKKAQELLLKLGERGIWNLDERRLYAGTRHLALREFAEAGAALGARVGSPFAPAAPGPRLDLARAQDAAELVGPAERSYQEVLKEAPEHPAALLRLAGLADQQFRRGAAGDFYERAEAAFRRRLNDEGVTLTLVQQAMGQQYVSVPKARELLGRAEAISPAGLTEGMRIKLALTKAVIAVMDGDNLVAERAAYNATLMAKGTGMEAGAAAGLVDLGLAYLVKSDLGQAEKTYLQAEETARGVGSIYLEKRARLGRAWAAALGPGRKADALAGLDEVEPFFIANRYRMQVLECWRIRGDVLYSAAEFEGALALYKKTAEGAQAEGYERVRRRARQLQSEILTRLGQFPEAVRVLRATMAEYEREGAEKEYPVHYFQCRVALGRVLSSQGKGAEARKVLEELLADPRLKSEAIRVQGKLALAVTLGEAGETSPALPEGIEGPERDEIRHHMCLDLAGRPEQAAEAVKACTAIAPELVKSKSWSFLAHVQIALGQAYFDLGQKDKAVAEWDAALALFERQQSRNNIFYVRLLLASVRTEDVQGAWKQLTAGWTLEEKRSYLGRKPIARRVKLAGVRLE